MKERRSPHSDVELPVSGRSETGVDVEMQYLEQPLVAILVFGFV
jgi:hypothetical protein